MIAKSKPRSVKIPGESTWVQARQGDTDQDVIDRYYDKRRLVLRLDGLRHWPVKK